jgi:hypothetical protein
MGNSNRSHNIGHKGKELLFPLIDNYLANNICLVSTLPSSVIKV